MVRLPLNILMPNVGEASDLRVRQEAKPPRQLGCVRDARVPCPAYQDESERPKSPKDAVPERTAAAL